MARICVDSSFFEIDGSGNLTFKRESVGLQELITFGTPGSFNFTKALFPGLTRLRVRAVGGGGGAAGVSPSAGNVMGSSSGAGGAYSESVIDASALGATESITVGTGGAGGVGNANGATGGTSSFGGFVIAPGGPGSGVGMPDGTFQWTSFPTASGPAGTGDIAIPGGPGGFAHRSFDGTVQVYPGGGSGGGYGFGGPGRVFTGNGDNGVGYGGGGSGAIGNGAPQNGGNGTGGAVFVELYF